MACARCWHPRLPAADLADQRSPAPTCSASAGEAGVVLALSRMQAATWVIQAVRPGPLCALGSGAGEEAAAHPTWQWLSAEQG